MNNITTKAGLLVLNDKTSFRLDNFTVAEHAGIVYVSSLRKPSWALDYRDTTINGTLFISAELFLEAIASFAFSKSVGDNAVLLTGDQTISGEKNFVGKLMFNSKTIAVLEDLTTVYRYKGTVTVLPTTGQQIGDVYIKDGDSWAWDGTEWDDWGKAVDLTGYYTKQEVDELIRAGVDDAYILNNFRPKETYTLLLANMQNTTYNIPEDVNRIVVKSVNENGVTYYARGLGFQKDMFHRGTGEGGVIPNASTYAVNAAFTTLTGVNIRGNGAGGVDVYRVDYSLAKIPQ